MNRQSIMIAILSVAPSIVWAAPAGWKTYHSTVYGFSIGYPGDGSFTPGNRIQPQRSMVPVCDDTSVACFEYSGRAFDHTVIESLGVSVNILRGVTSQADCNQIDQKPASSVIINGTRFVFEETGSAAAGNSAGGPVYRAFHQNVCFEITLFTAQSDLPPAQYQESGIEPLNEDALRKAHDVMNRMLHSFVFAGRVLEQSPWSVYRDSKCGSEFEVPAGSEVQQQPPFTPPASIDTRPTLAPTCGQWFTSRGHVYAISEKVDFSSRKQIDEWLSLSAFPPLAKAARIGNGNLEYKGSDRAYLVIRGQLFLFSVSGVAAQSRPVHEDPVFTHLVASFRWPEQRKTSAR